MKRFIPASLTLVLLLFVSSYPQSGRVRQQTASSTASVAGTPSQSPPLMREDDHQPLSVALNDTEFENADGTTATLTNYKGKIVLVNLWAIWCGPCREEMPQLQALFDTYHAKGLEVLGLNAGDHNGEFETITKIQGFARQKEITYSIGRAPRPFIHAMYALSKQHAVPQTILIDRDNRLRAIYVGGGRSIYDQLRENVKTLMAEP